MAVVGAAALATVAIGAWAVIRHRATVRGGAIPVVLVGPPLIRAAPRPTKAVAFADGCATAECHADLIATPIVHAPVGDVRCQECHAPDAGGHTYPILRAGSQTCSTCHSSPIDSRHAHGGPSGNDCLACHDPHASSHSALLAGPTPGDACWGCHTRAEGAVQHASYKAGRCGDCHDSHAPNGDPRAREQAACETCHVEIGRVVEHDGRPHGSLEHGCVACHAPHASDSPGLLAAQPQEMCVRCHADVAQSMQLAVTHGGMLAKEQCLACHDPHSNRNGAMLRDGQVAVCMGCHDKAVTAADGRQIADMSRTLLASPVKHGPVMAGNCGACHAVHGSEHHKLLCQENGEPPLGRFDLRNYELCFSCHDRALVLEDGAAATQFRDGVTNLHRLHVKGGEQSRACRTCHEVHAGQRPRLIAETVSYEGSEWKSPMGFVATEEGGSCSPGCHAPRTYSRHAATSLGTIQGGAP